MAQPSEVADRAIELASAYLKSKTGEMVSLAGGDMETLREAAQIVQSRPAPKHTTALSAEHLAFSLITAAYESLRRQAEPELARRQAAAKTAAEALTARRNSSAAKSTGAASTRAKSSRSRSRRS